jgi:hypothetical protein
VASWWWGKRRAPSCTPAPHLDPAKVERERERIREHADSRIEEIENQANDWRERLDG